MLEPSKCFTLKLQVFSVFHAVLPSSLTNYFCFCVDDPPGGAEIMYLRVAPKRGILFNPWVWARAVQPCRPEMNWAMHALWR